jgi:hypothetical protein
MDCQYFQLEHPSNKVYQCEDLGCDRDAGYLVIENN